MNLKIVRLAAPLVAICFLQLACYNKYQISNDELANLDSSHIAHRVTVETAEGPVEVRATTPIEVLTTEGERHSVSPFNFTFGDRDLVAPDYDLLLSRSQIDGALVREFSKGRTVGLIVGSLLAAGGGFALISVLAGKDQGPGAE